MYFLDINIIIRAIMHKKISGNKTCIRFFSQQPLNQLRPVTFSSQNLEIAVGQLEPLVLKGIWEIIQTWHLAADLQLEFAKDGGIRKFNPSFGLNNGRQCQVMRRSVWHEA
jgi:hypothetical protein